MSLGCKNLDVLSNTEGVYLRILLQDNDMCFLELDLSLECRV